MGLSCSSKNNLNENPTRTLPTFAISTKNKDVDLKKQL